MRIQTYFFALFTLCAFGCVTAYAQSTNGGNSCIHIEDDAARLACFDQAFPTDASTQEPRNPANAANSANESAQETVSAPAPEAPDEPTQGAAVNVAPSSVGAADVSATSGADVSETFGMAQKNPAPVTSTKPSSTKPSSTELRGTVQKVSKRVRGQHVVHLENGQIWQENFASRYFPVDPGDTVIIRKRRFGGYRLVTESGKGFRVERVQ